MRRRDFIKFSSVSLFVSGCASTGGTASHRPGPVWPEGYDRPAAQSSTVYTPARPAPAPAPAVVTPATPVAASPISAIPRARWAKAAPIPARVNPMKGVSRITVHHEGWTPVAFSDAATTAARLEQIRKSHLQRLGAGDIGYHFVIDRAGRVWEGRSLAYQGAHVRAANEHNLGIMVLGNFDRQTPSDAQVAVLRDTLGKLMKTYRVPVSRVYTHQEINPTACPGRNLQPRMVSLRKGNALA